MRAQVKNVSDLGSVEEVAKLVLPRGSRLLNAGSETFALQPKVLAGTLAEVLGEVELPPVSYYR
eukprot:83312-Chlamydomonas_euryale.AAC.2